MKEKTAKSSLGTKIAFIILLMILSSTMAVGIYVYLVMRNDSIDKSAKNAQTIAMIIANVIDVEKFSDIVSANAKNEYWHSVKSLLDETKGATDAEYLYILDSNTDEPSYFAEGMKYGDDPRIIGDLGQRENPNIFASEAFEAISTGRVTATKIYHTDGFGYMVSGFAPVLNSSGRAIGVVGVDIGVDAVLATVHSMGLRIIFVVVFFSLSFLLISIWYVRRTVSKPLALILSAAESIANGDMDFDISSISSSNDEIGRVCTSLTKVSGTLSMIINDIDNMSFLHTSGNFKYKLDESKYEGTYACVVKGINSMTFMYVEMFNELLNVLQRFGKGDFEANVNKYPGELEICNVIIDELRNDLKNINSEITALARAAKDGNLSMRVNHEGFTGSWSKILYDLNDLLEAMENPLTEITEVLSDIEAGRLERKMTGVYKGHFSKVQTILNQTTSTLSGYINGILDMVTQLTSNNLDISIDREFKGDFIVIKDSLNALSTQFSTVLSDIDDAVNNVLNGAEQMSDSSELLLQGITQQAEVMEAILADIEICAEQTRQDGVNAEKTLSITEQSKNDINTSSEEMKNLLHAMDGISAASRNIASIIRAIDDIAFQTNLLALNASVEAARAGQHGSGFAVVADEVRSLATRSQTAASETADLIEDTAMRVNTGTDLAKNTASFLGKTVDGIHSISELMSIIEKSGEIQGKSFSSARQGLESISLIIQRNSDVSKENSDISQQMYDQAKVLSSKISTFKLKKFRG